MRAWYIKSLEGIDNITLGEIPDPEPAANEAVIRVLIAALNPADRYLAEGAYPAKPAFPHILGRDAIGIIELLGQGASDFRPGDGVIVVRSEIGVTRPGTFAERVAVPMESLVRPPADWSDEESAGATLVYLTAYQAITQWRDLPRQAVVLITGASGGVGVAAAQLAGALGYTVIGLSRVQAKAARLRAMGADATFDPTDSNWPGHVKDFLAGRRVDLAIDNIGGATLVGVIETLGQNGRISCIGRLGGPVEQFNTASLFFRRLQIRGVAVGSYTPAESQTCWREIERILSGAGVRPLIDSIFVFEQLPEAFEKLRRGPMGKVLLKVSA